MDTTVLYEGLRTLRTSREPEVLKSLVYIDHILVNLIKENPPPFICFSFWFLLREAKRGKIFYTNLYYDVGFFIIIILTRDHHHMYK
jgi:hypothetical protein